MLMEKLASSFVEANELSLGLIELGHNINSETFSKISKFDVKQLAQGMYSEFLSQGYISIVNTNSWQLTSRGAEFFVTMRELADRYFCSVPEFDLQHVLAGFLVGLFNANNPNLSRTFEGAVKISQEYYLGKVLGAANSIRNEARDILNGETANTHGPDFNDVVFNIIDKTTFLTHAYQLAIERKDNGGLLTLMAAALELYYGEDTDFLMSLIGVMLAMSL